MILFRRLFLVTALAVVAFGLRAGAQEALEIRGDQDAPATEPTPIPERTAEPRPPAESDAEAEAKPKKKAPKEGEITDVQQMSPDQFKKAGLDKLSPAELQTLNQWLKGYKHAAETKAAEQATVEATEKTKTETKSNFNRSWLSTDRIFSRIDGKFTGIR